MMKIHIEYDDFGEYLEEYETLQVYDGCMEETEERNCAAMR